jgi:RimJ/RimL family protein N-acetyltransferase
MTVTSSSQTIPAVATRPFTSRKKGSERYSIGTYMRDYRLPLISAIDEVCGEGLWMRTQRFKVTPAWEHALSAHECSNHLLLVALASHRPVGWCRLFPDKGGDDIRLGVGLLVHHRNQGLGTKMVRTGLLWAKDQGFQRVSLDTRGDNQRAIYVFERCGFTKTGRRSGIWLEMAYELAHSRPRRPFNAR